MITLFDISLSTMFPGFTLPEPSIEHRLTMLEDEALIDPLRAEDIPWIPATDFQTTLAFLEWNVENPMGLYGVEHDFTRQLEAMS